MKMFAMLSVLSGIIICPPADARSMQMHQQEVFHHVEIDGEKTGYVGVLDINFHDGSVQLQIMQDRCGHFAVNRDPSVMRCMAMPTAVRTLKAPLTGRENDGCGTVVYSAFEDKTPMDGMRIEIKARDHGRRVCDDFRPYSFDVEASSFNPWTQQTTKYFLGKTNR